MNKNELHGKRDLLDPKLHPEIAHVRRNAGSYLQELGAMGLITGVDGSQKTFTQIDYIGMSACFFVPGNSGLDLVKLRTFGTPGEAESLQIWETHGVSVPKVKEYGILPSTETSESDFKVTYMIQEAVLDKQGKPAPTAEDVIKDEPHLIEQVGGVLGSQLALIHAIPAEEQPFGSTNEADRWNSSGDSWGEVLEDQFRRQAHHLRGLGFSGVEIARVADITASLPFSTKKTYLHNDFNPHNSLVPSREPLQVVIIDPNPMVGDRHWDLAYVANKVETEKVSNVLKKGSGTPVSDHEERYAVAFNDTYTELSGVTPDPRLLLACQLPRTLRSYDFFVSRSEGQFGALEGNIRFEAIKQTAISQATRLLQQR